MKSYILVSLWAADDEATCISHDFARRLNERRPAAALVAGESPRQEELRAAAQTAPDAAVVVFAHGGASLSARSGGQPWVHAAALAELVPGRRVYAFACSTFELQARLLFSTFAIQAVDACIAVFVGHQAPVMTPLRREGVVSNDMEAALFSMLDRFIDGEDSDEALRNCGRRFASWDLPIELDLPSEDADQAGAFGWSKAAYLGGFFNSLRVLSKAPKTHSE